MRRAALLLLLLLVPFVLPSDAPAPPLAPRIFDLFQISGEICTDGQFIVNNNATEWVCGDPAATTTSGAILDLADDAVNESTGIAEIATDEAAPSIFTESAPNKLLINTAQPWPTSSALSANGDNCNAGEAAGGVDAAGAAEACIDPLTATELGSEAQLESLIGVGVFTPTDGSLADDNLGDNLISDLNNVSSNATAADDAFLMGNGIEYQSLTWPSCDPSTQKIHYDTATNGMVCQADANDGGEVGGGSSIVLDLGDDGSNESTGILEIATDESPSAIFSEPTPNQLKINTAQPWPTASALSGNPDNCNVGEAAAGISGAGTAEGCFAPLTSSDVLADLSNVNADVTAADEQILLGNGTEFHGVTWPSCNSATQKVHLDPDTNALTCVADVSSGTTTLDAAFDAGTGVIDGALCGTKSVKISNGFDDFIEICVDAGGQPKIIATCDGAGCDNVQSIATGREFVIQDSAAGLDMFKAIPAAASPHDMYPFSVGYQPLASVEWPASAMFGDGAECDTAPTDETINGIPTQGLRCPMTSAETDGFIYGLPITIPGDLEKTADVEFSIKAYLITDGGAGTWHGSIGIQCVPEGEPPGNYGSAVGLDLTPVLADVVNDEIHDVAAAVVDTDTTGADCDAGDTLYWRYLSCDTDATPSEDCTSSAGFENDMSIFSVRMEYKKNSLSE